MNDGFEARSVGLYGFIHGGDQIYVRDENKTGVKVYSVEDGNPIIHFEDIHTKPIYTIRVLADSDTMLTGGRDKCVKCLSLST